jgi:hypothetical protein
MTDSGATSSTISSSRWKWRVLLPITNLVVAVCLLLVGHHQQRTLSPQRSATITGGEWTPAGEAPLAPGTQVAFAINFPALLVASPLQRVSQSAVIAGFLCALLIVWYLVGRVLDSGIPRPSHKSMAIATVSLIGLAGSVAGIWFAWRAVGVHYVIPPAGALVWLVAFGTYCFTVLKSALQNPPLGG